VKQVPHIIRLDTVDSTSTYLRENPELREKQFCTVLAREQTGGRGRSGRTWSSAPGLDLTFSMVYLPPKSMSDLSCITLIAGLAVHRALERHCGCDLNLKWPNDIRWKNSKLGGILCEMVQAPGVPVVIIGIGININRLQFPEEIAATATSLKTITGTDHSIEGIFNEIHHHCIRLLSDFKVPLTEGLIIEWENASRSIGSPVRFVLHGRAEEGVLSAIDTDGSLRIIRESGETIRGYRGEVLFPDDE
jgi:BirA family transcriptional regulator, biotin operon repressor / biotin---[acetyl-CoA-carboxylase] ligase